MVLSAYTLHKVLKRLDRLESRSSFQNINVLDYQLPTSGGADVAPALDSLPAGESTNLIKRIVLTGGPCAGKTTALAIVAESMEGFGITVFCVPEASTMLFASGYPYPVKGGTKAQMLWESNKLNIQKHLEDTFYQAARECAKPVVILCDRGMCDTKGYLQHADDWFELLERNRWSEEDLYARYDGVMHLVTAACGAEEFYTGENNQSRRESSEEARALENRLREAWSGHPHVMHVTNDGFTFQDKMDNVVDLIKSQMNVTLDKNLGSKKKVFILEGQLPVLDDARVYQITSTWLKGFTEGKDEVLRKRSKDGVNTYILCSRKIGPRESTGKKQSRETYLQRRLTRSVYKELMKQADSEYASLNRKRCCFLDTFDDREALFNLDILEEGTLRLRIDHVNENAGPDAGGKSRLGDMRWIDVTHEEEFTLRQLSLKRARMMRLSQQTPPKVEKKR